MSKPCCEHPVERHAYNGCANCSCCVRWAVHPDRERDASPEGRRANARRRIIARMRRHPRASIRAQGDRMDRMLARDAR